MKYFTQHLIVRYIISGGTSAAVNLLTFTLLFSVLHLNDVFASVMGFVVSFSVSLFLQKFWTFKDHSTYKMHHQIAKYLLTSLFGLVVNTTVFYLVVHHTHIYGLSNHQHLYGMFGQIVAGLFTACCTFPLSKKYVFNRDPIDQIPIV